MSHSWMPAAAAAVVLATGCKDKPCPPSPPTVCEDCPKPVDPPVGEATSRPDRYDLPPMGANHIRNVFPRDDSHEVYVALGVNPQMCDLQARPFDDVCPSGCVGPNSPLTNEFPVDGLSTEGCRNRDGVRFVKDSFRLAEDRCFDDANKPLTAAKLRTAKLALENGELVARDGSNGPVLCNGAELRGASFQLEGRLGPAIQPKGIWTLDVKIEDTGRVEMLAEGGGPAASAPTYLMTVDGEPMCPSELPFMASTGAPPAPPPASTPASPALPTHHAVLLPGELYTYKLGAVKLHDDHRAKWFNVACAGGAVAKLRLMGADPVVDPNGDKQRVATLKMLTARYCGDVSRTVSGTLVNRADPNGPAPANAGPIEAKWNELGARCISHSRLWKADPNAVMQLPDSVFEKLPRTLTEDEFVAKVRSECNIKACDDPAVPAEPFFWATYTTDHSHP